MLIDFLAITEACMTIIYNLEKEQKESIHNWMHNRHYFAGEKSANFHA